MLIAILIPILERILALHSSFYERQFALGYSKNY